MTSGDVKAQCWFCQHFDLKSVGWKKTATCTAFPDGIPTEIFVNLFDHREKYENDNDIQFLQHPLDDMSKRSFSLLLTGGSFGVRRSGSVRDILEYELTRLYFVLDNVRPHFEISEED